MTTTTSSTKPFKMDASTRAIVESAKEAVARDPEYLATMLDTVKHVRSMETPVAS